MTRLFLVRHGPTHVKSMVGWSDLPADLSDTDQISRLRAYLPADGVMVSSDLIRARATADALQGNHARLTDLHDLREMHFGDWELQRFDQIEAHSPDHIRAFWETPGSVRAPGGENWNELRARVDGAIDGLIAAHSGQNLIVVVHFGVIITQIQRTLGQSTTEAFGQHIDNLSVTCLTHTPTGWQSGAINHCP